MRTAVVTGTASGIGLATVELLVANDFDVLATSIEPDVPSALARIDPSGARVVYVSADLTEPSRSASRIAELATERWTSLDLLVNNAARILHGPIDDVDESDWLELLNVNLVAPFFLARELRPLLAEARGGVVNISSTNALRVNLDNLAYDVSKAALNQLTRALALEFRASGIRVNALMPAGTDTPSLARWANAASSDEESANDLLATGRAEGSIADPADIARGVLMLASSDAYRVSGATIAIDGAWSL